MNNKILQADVQDFIQANLNTDLPKLLLKATEFHEVSTKEIVEQIEAKRKAKTKTPTWFLQKNTYFPNKLNLSQSSSEQTARYKANLVHGKTIADLTAGFGIDTHAFSKVANTVYHIEQNEELAAIAKHNMKQLRIPNVVFCAEDGITWLQKNASKLDWLYIDPSRRTKTQKKVYFLSDCEPNVVEHLALFFLHTDNVMVKTGPLLDIDAGLQQLIFVKEIHIVAVHNDVKEVLWILKKNYTKEPQITTVNLEKNSAPSFHFTRSEEKLALSNFSEPKNYLYEPNAALLKSGAFKLLGQRLALHKLHPHSHLYTSNSLVAFPGRTFTIGQVVPYNKKVFTKLGISKANVTTRNFPYTVSAIRKKLKLKDGGEDYLFFTTDINNQFIVVCCKKTPDNDH